MKKIIDLSNKEAKDYFLKGNSYFNIDLPNYLSFEPMLYEVADVLKNISTRECDLNQAKQNPGVNYSFLSNKDGRFAWRPLELIHPVIYVSLVNEICDPNNWLRIQKRFSDFKDGAVECCSELVISNDNQKDVATQVMNWWQKVEQQSLIYSLNFSHLLHTDVIDCYGSLYTHSISWAIHGIEVAKQNKQSKSLLGNKIDVHIQASRYGQTNGIPQGSVLMDFISEIVLGYVDEQIKLELGDSTDFRILRYRDDYRIFANSDERVEKILQVVSAKLRLVGMKLGVSKTHLCKNVVEGAIKPDKLAGIDLQDLGKTNAKTIQKQLLRLHSFGQRFPNSGALRRLISDFYTAISSQKVTPDDLEVQVAIATDIGFISPSTFPVIAAILSHLISIAPHDEKINLWTKVRNKMARVPYNGYLEIWLQRVTQPKEVGIPFISEEPICKIVNGETIGLWENGWINCNILKSALDVSKIVIKSVNDAQELVQPDEVLLFKQKALLY